MAWRRVFIDSQKASEIYELSGTGDIREALSAAKVTIIPGILTLDLKKLLPRPKVDAVITDMYRQAPQYSVSDFVALVVQHGASLESLRRSVVVVAADNPPVERFRIVQPEGPHLSILSSGSYLAYRPPFRTTVLADGQYHSAYLFSMLDTHAPGSKDALKVQFRGEASPDIVGLLCQSDNHHARVLGVVGDAGQYRCQVKYEEGNLDEIDEISTTVALYAIALEVQPLSDSQLLDRLTSWRDWGVVERRESPPILPPA